MMSNNQGWTSIKDGMPPKLMLCEVRTNSKDRSPREATYDEGFKTFYNDNGNEVTGEEWRPIQGKTPITDDPATIAYSLDIIPEGAIIDKFNSNEYFTTYQFGFKKYVYHHTHSEIRSPWGEI